jgi:hypothetical protein
MYTNPALGEIHSDTEEVLRKSGEKWDQHFTLELKKMPEQGRRLAAMFELIDRKAEEAERKHPVWTPIEGRYMDRPIAIGRLIMYLPVKP